MRDDVRKVPKDKYIYEFSDTLMHGSNQKIPHYDEENGDTKKIVYRQMYPDFTKSKGVPPGICAPCCAKGIIQGIGIEMDGDKKDTQKTYFDPIKHEELQQKKDEWMIKTKDGWKIDFNKLNDPNYMDEYKFKTKALSKQPDVNRPKRRKKYCKHIKDVNDEERKTESKSTKNSSVETINDKPSYNFPLEENQLGYMNIYLQEFFNFDNKSICYKDKKDDDEGRKLKKDTFCLLRLGIEKNIKQSFLYLLSNVYEFYDSKDEEEKSREKKHFPTKNINDFKKYFTENLTIDKFVSAQNGILTKLFVKNTDNIDDEKINKYNDSIYFGNVTEKKIKKRVISAFENFKEYILDENEEIDYKYIWDLVCKPINDGGVLFKDGINLLIFKETNDDMTFNKIEIICPMNYYSSEFFDNKKKTLMVVTNGDFYEPLCSVKWEWKKNKKGEDERVKNWTITRFFPPPYLDKNKKVVSPKWDYAEWKTVGVELHKTIELIKKNLFKYCQAKKSVKDKIYDYTTNISFNELKKKLSPDSKINIHQIFNSNNKIVGGLYKFDKKNKKYIYIPTEPSPIDTSLEMKYINNLQEFYLDYKTTKDELEKLSNLEGEKKIPCKPISKILENGLIVGIRTETNQFVPVIPVENNEDDDDIKKEENYINKNDEEYSNEYQLDEYIINNNTRDDAMLKVVKSIKLENNFYTMFRNTLKIMLSDKKYKEKKEEIKKIANDKTKTYVENFKILRNKLIELLSRAIEFIETELDTIGDFEELISCFGLDSSSCSGEEGKKSVGCFLRKNVCSLILPKINLFNFRG